MDYSLKQIPPGCCKECFQASLVEDYTDGSIVCTKCGLVNEPFLFDERPIIDTSRCINYDDGYDELSHCKDEDMMYLEHSFSVPSSVLLSSLQKWRSMNQIHGLKGVNRKAMKAACVYWTILHQKISGQLYSLDDVGNALCLPLGKVHEMWKLLDPISHGSLPRGSKYLPLCCVLPNNVHSRTVIRECEMLEEWLLKHRSFVDKKPSKMIAAIFHVVCCPKYVPALPVKDILEVTGVSVTTFKRHFQSLKTCVQERRQKTSSN